MFKRFKLNNWHVFYFLIVIAVLSFAGSARAHFNSGDIAWWSWWDGALQNFSTEMLGAIITFGLIEVLVGSRNKQEELVQQLRAGDVKVLNVLKDNGIRINEIDLSRVNWKGLNLEGANLEGANLEGANLEGANLEGANLEGANLEGTNLWNANLERANLETADLTDAILKDAKLWRAKLWRAHFKGANLEGANLGGADLTDVYLDNKNLLNVKLPDGSVWTEDDENYGRFRDIENPDYEETRVEIKRFVNNHDF